MSGRRVGVWVAALTVAGMVYIVSVIATGEHAQNGAWLVMVAVFVAAGVDAAIVVVRELAISERDDD